MNRPEPELTLPCPSPDRERTDRTELPPPDPVLDPDAEETPPAEDEPELRTEPAPSDQPDTAESREPDAATVRAEPCDPADPAESSEPDLSVVRPVLSGLRIAVPWALSCFAALVFVWSAVTVLSSAELTREKIGRALLGSLFGGPDSVIVSLPGVSPSHPAPDGRRSDSLLLPPDGTIPAPKERAEAEKNVPPPADPEEPEHDPGQDEPASEDPSSLPASPIRFTNETGYAPDPDALLSSPRAVPKLEDLRASWGEDAPLVLILHTHGTEAYSEAAAGNWRSADPSLSVVSLGGMLADRLREAGIPAIHLTTLFDTPDFNLSYYNAAQSIREVLALHPSVSYILDLHRDSMVFPDGTVYAPVTEIGGTRTAQLMFVVGTDEAGAEHPGWRDNLSLALRMQTALSARYPTLMRDINLRSASFNEQYTKGSLLVEIGASGCTHEEAEAAVTLLADALTDEIRGD